MRLSKPIMESGCFWLSENPELRFLGSLHISKKGNVELDAISDGDYKFTSDNMTPCRINGMLKSKGPVTLEGCLFRSTTRYGSGLSTANIVANTVLIGASFYENEAISFSSLALSLEGLHEWLLTSGIRYEDKGDSKYSFHFESPEEIAIDLPIGIRLKFKYSWTRKILYLPKKAKISHKAYVVIEFDEQKKMEDIASVILRINNFLSFALDKVVDISSIYGFSEEKTMDIGGEKRKIPISLFYSRPFKADKKGNVNVSDMLFTYKDISGKASEIITEWFRNYGTSEPAFNLYFGYKNGAYTYLESSFLSLVQGLETLHRRNSKEKVMSEEEFSNIIEIISNASPLGKAEWVRERMAYANELSLRKRLTQMIEPFAKYYENEEGSTKRLINQVVLTRNYLTHYDDRNEDQILRHKDLYNVCLKIEVLFQLHFMRVIGIGNERIEEIIKNNRKLRWKLGIE